MKFLTLARALRQCRIGSRLSPAGATAGTAMKRLARATAALLAVLASSVMFANTAAAATRVFTDGFEDGTTNKWSFPGTYCPATVVNTARDGGSPHTGSKMLEGNWDATVPWTNACPDPTIYTYAHLPSWDYTN